MAEPIEMQFRMPSQVGQGNTYYMGILRGTFRGV